MGLDEFFATASRPISRRSAACQARSNAGSHDREDVLQETALRLAQPARYSGEVVNDEFDQCW